MKSFLMLLVGTVLAVQAHAIGSLNLDLRTDMTSQSYNDAAKAAGGVSNYRFNLQTARLDYKGTLNESVTYRVRARIAGKDQGLVDKRDSTNPTLDYAYATHKMSDTFKLTVGKLSSEIGGFEAVMPGADNYYNSEAFAGTSYLGKTAASGNANLAGFANLQYLTGAKLTTTFDTQELSLIVTDLDTRVGRNTSSGSGDVLENGKTAQNKSLLGLSYRGTFLDKQYSTYASYHAETLAEDISAEFIGAGVQWNSNPFMVQLEYLANNSQFLLGTTVLKDTLSSVQLRTGYNIDEQTVIGLRATASEEKIDAATAVKNKYTTVGASVEFKPKAEDVYRYHFAYNARTVKTETGDDRNLNEVIVGMRINADFLK